MKGRTPIGDGIFWAPKNLEFADDILNFLPNIFTHLSTLFNPQRLSPLLVVVAGAWVKVSCFLLVF